jgi:hypothetical protein
MRLILRGAVPNKVLVALEGDFNTPESHQEYLRLLATQDHPVQRLFLEYLAERCSGLEMTFLSATKYEITCLEGTIGEGAWALYKSLGPFADTLWRHPELERIRVHNLIHKLDVDFWPKDFVTFWLGGVQPADRPAVRDYLERLDAR